jgi:hypothetical protein
MVILTCRTLHFSRAQRHGPIDWLPNITSSSAAPVLLENALPVLSHVVTVRAQIAPTELMIIGRVLRAVPLRPLCLEPIQGLTIPLVPLFVLKPRLPGLMTVLAIGIDPAA